MQEGTPPSLRSSLSLSHRMALRNVAEAVNGPTPGQRGDLGAFAWRKKWEGVAHKGMPEVFAFAFELQQL